MRGRKKHKIFQIYMPDAMEPVDYRTHKAKDVVDAMWRFVLDVFENGWVFVNPTRDVGFMIREEGEKKFRLRKFTHDYDLNEIKDLKEASND